MVKLYCGDDTVGEGKIAQRPDDKKLNTSNSSYFSIFNMEKKKKLKMSSYSKPLIPLSSLTSHLGTFLGYPRKQTLENRSSGDGWGL